MLTIELIELFLTIFTVFIRTLGWELLKVIETRTMQNVQSYSGNSIQYIIECSLFYLLIFFYNDDIFTDVDTSPPNPACIFQHYYYIFDAISSVRMSKISWVKLVPVMSILKFAGPLSILYTDVAERFPQGIFTYDLVRSFLSLTYGPAATYASTNPTFSDYYMFLPLDLGFCWPRANNLCIGFFVF